jgi:translation initiation factor eIF-2B subunit alpha
MQLCIGFLFIIIFNFREEMAEDLRKANINCTVILDSAVGHVMEKVDMVMVGAEGVVESGGIINKVKIICQS